MISPMRARVLAQKSEEATASSGSLLATPLRRGVDFVGMIDVGSVGRIDVCYVMK